MASSTNAKKYKIKKYKFPIAVMFFFVSCITSKKEIYYSNILNFYYKNQTYSKSRDGKFIKVFEKQLVDSLQNKFKSVSNIVIIEQFCQYNNINGVVYSESSDHVYFSNEGGKSNIILKTNSPNFEHSFYNRIDKLLLADSLRYYEQTNKNESPINDEFCWLYVVSVKKQGDSFIEAKYTFQNPLALRQKILGY